MKILFALLFSALGVHAAPTLDFYIVDVGQGNATLIVAPSGQTMLFDAGPVRTAGRVLAVMKEAGVRQIDYLAVSHYHEDHFGGVMEIAAQTPVRNFLDHGPSLEYNQSEDWWKTLKGPQFRQNLHGEASMAKTYDALFDRYTAAIQKGVHTVVNPGDKIPLKGVGVVAVCARGKVISHPLKGAGAPNAACAGAEMRLDDYEEDGQSIGLLFTLGKFRFIQLGDLTWNFANRFFCPSNPVGTVDAYVISHHARSYPKESGDNSWSLSSAPKAEVWGLHPRVALLSLSHGAQIRRADALSMVHSSPGLEDQWQTELITQGAEKEFNAAEKFIANVGDAGGRPLYIKVSARADGSFTVTNSRNGFTKEYGPR
jgi:competence protein ComEC